MSKPITDKELLRMYDLLTKMQQTFAPKKRVVVTFYRPHNPIYMYRVLINRIMTYKVIKEFKKVIR